jgi:hypothetical protein
MRPAIAVGEVLPLSAATIERSSILTSVPASATDGVIHRVEVSMPQKPISATKVRQLLHFSTVENFNKSQSAKRLKMARSTATKYVKAFHRSG